MNEQLERLFADIEKLPFGTRFFKADLHFHTPASEDARGINKYGYNPYGVPYPLKFDPGNPAYEYAAEVRKCQDDFLERSRVKAREIVWRFCQQGLSIVAVTDHNGIGTIWDDDQGIMDLAAPTWYELIDDAAQEINHSGDCTTRLLILPGVEISTTGVHILAIFPPQEPRRKAHFIICELLNEVGLGPDAWGKNPKAGNASVYDTLALITKKGGLAIPAHIDGSDQSVLELYELTGAAMKNVLQSEHLGAVEVVDPNTLTNRSEETNWLSLKAWFDQARREKGLSSLAYFQGSDAHDLRTIAKRFTYLKMTEPSFSGLKTAIKMPSSRVRIADSRKEFNGMYIRGLIFQHPFLGEQTLRFNRNLNCISGKRSVGKTTLFNLLQGASDLGDLQKQEGDVPFEGSATLFVDLVDQVGQETADPEKFGTDLDLLRDKNLLDGHSTQQWKSKLVNDRVLIQVVKEIEAERLTRKGSISRQYAYCREAGQDKAVVYPLDGEGNPLPVKTVDQLPRLRFYNAKQMEEIVDDKMIGSSRDQTSFQKFLCKYFGAPSEENVRKFNDLFMLPRFLDGEIKGEFSERIQAELGRRIVELKAEKDELETDLLKAEWKKKKDEIEKIKGQLPQIQDDLETTQLRAELEKVKARLQKSEDGQEREKIKIELEKKTGELFKNIDTRLGKIAGELAAGSSMPEKKADSLKKRKDELEKTRKELEAGQSPKISEAKRTDQLLELTWGPNPTDLYQLSMNILWRTGDVHMKDFFSLTRSQRKTAMICMLLMSSDLPIILDTPEDEFDNDDMTKFLVPLILELKDTRQILLFTNHPILAVNTDPDNYLLIPHYAKKAGIVSGFAVDAELKKKKRDDEVDRKLLLLEILEGDLGAFRKRASRYE